MIKSLTPSLSTYFDSGYPIMVLKLSKYAILQLHVYIDRDHDNHTYTHTLSLSPVGRTINSCEMVIWHH